MWEMIPSRAKEAIVSLVPARVFARIEPFGLFVIVALLAAGLLDNLMRPLIAVAESIIAALTGL